VLSGLTRPRLIRIRVATATQTSAKSIAGIDPGRNPTHQMVFHRSIPRLNIDPSPRGSVGYGFAAIVRQTLRDQKDIRDDLVGRIAALGETNDLLIKSHWRTASLREILVREFAPYDLYRFDLDGPNIECPSSIAVLLALVVHEMTTNASKYGALSNITGHISVTWKTHNNRFELEWLELGGPKPNEPSRYGFGTKLLQTGLSQFNGSAKIFFEPSGARIALALDFPQEIQSISLDDLHHNIQAV